MAAQSWVSHNGYYLSASGAAYASSTTATDVTPAPQYTIPGNSLVVGQLWRVKAWGSFSNTGTPTLILGVYYGGVAGTALVTSGTITTPTGVTNQTWELETILQIRSIGSSGSIFAVGHALGMNAATNAVNMMPATGPAVTSSLDTTTNKILTVGATWGTNSASNTLTLLMATIEQLN